MMLLALLCDLLFVVLGTLFYLGLAVTFPLVALGWMIGRLFTIDGERMSDSATLGECARWWFIEQWGLV